MMVRHITRRRMRRLRIQANRLYRLLRRPSAWAELSTLERAEACALLVAVGSPHRFPLKSWGATGMRPIRFVERRR